MKEIESRRHTALAVTQRRRRRRRRRRQRRQRRQRRHPRFLNSFLLSLIVIESHTVYFLIRIFTK